MGREIDAAVTTPKAMRLASLVTAINVLVASGFSVAAIIRPQLLVPAGSVLMSRKAREPQTDRSKERQ
jgi:hypothetical protein